MQYELLVRRMLIKVLHVITGLNVGGAETMLYKLLSRMDRRSFQAEVVSLTDIGPVGRKIQALGVPVRALGMRRGVPDAARLLRLAGWLRHHPPDVIQTWMYHADLVGGLAAKLAGGIPVAWDVQHANLDPTRNKRSTIWTAHTCAWLSRWLPSAIVCSSEAAQAVHARLGYALGRMVVIPNGFDLDVFRPDPESRLAVRRQLEIPEDSLLIGLVARFHPQKDHYNFVQAAGLLHRAMPEVHFLLCGEGITWENPVLGEWIDDAGVESCCHLLGRREDMPRLTAALDVASSSSFGEGFPNVVGEAMACGVPCVVTDVGDCAAIVGDTGIVVPPRDPTSLASAWHKLLSMGREEGRRSGERARLRVKSKYDLGQITRRYERLYKALLLGESRNETA